MSISGLRPITTPAAWVEALRNNPSSSSAVSISRATVSSAFCNSCRRGSPSIACRRLTGLAGLKGISSAILFT